jgi:hypothetical protein
MEICAKKRRSNFPTPQFTKTIMTLDNRKLCEHDISDLRPSSLNQILQNNMETEDDQVIKSEYIMHQHKNYRFNDNDTQQLQNPANDDNNNIDRNDDNEHGLQQNHRVNNDNDDDKSNNNDNNLHCNNIQLIITNDINQQHSQRNHGLDKDLTVVGGTNNNVAQFQHLIGDESRALHDEHNVSSNL